MNYVEMSREAERHPARSARAGRMVTRGAYLERNANQATRADQPLTGRLSPASEQTPHRDEVRVRRIASLFRLRTWQEIA